MKLDLLTTSTILLTAVSPCYGFFKSVSQQPQISVQEDRVLTCKKNTNLTVSASAEVDIVPTIANIQVSFSATDADSAVASAKVETAREAVNDLIRARFPDIGTSTITARGRAAVAIAKQEPTPDWQRGEKDEIVDENGFTASAKYTISIEPLDDLVSFTNSMAAIDDLKITEVQWKPSEAALRNAKRALRKKATVSCFDAGNDYAEVLADIFPTEEPLRLELVGMQEEWIDSEPQETFPRFGYWDESRLKLVDVPNLQMSVRASCDFRV